MRETVETVMGVVYWSDNGWETVMKRNVSGIGGSRKVTGKAADLARFLALAKYGGGRDDQRRKA